MSRETITRDIRAHVRSGSAEPPAGASNSTVLERAPLAAQNKFLSRIGSANVKESGSNSLTLARGEDPPESSAGECFKVGAGQDPQAGPPPFNPSPESTPGVDGSLLSERNHHQVLDLVGEGGIQGRGRKGAPPADGQRRKNARTIKTCRRILSRMGILEPTLTELVDLPHVGRIYLERWERWMSEHPTIGTGLVVINIRARIQAPMSSKELQRMEFERYGILH
jgi:hypothetical protein